MDKKFPVKLSPIQWGIGLAVLLYMANFASVQLGGPPFLYCFVLKIAPAFAGWYALITVGAAVWFGAAFLLGGSAALGKPILFMAVAFGLPVFADAMLRLGGSCG